MVEITKRARYFYEKHGWTDEDIAYAVENSFKLHDEDGWAMFAARAPDGVVWLYPTSQANTFPKTLWREIKRYITDEDLFKLF